MAQRRARIESPEVLKELRTRFATFDQTCRNALLGIRADVKSTGNWLRSDQRMHWKHQLRKADEDLNQAQREYSQARWKASHQGSRSSGVEEKRTLDRAKRRREEVERKMKTVSKWMVLLDQQISKMMGPINSLSILLDQRTPAALARVDQLLDSLEEYFRKNPTEEK